MMLACDLENLARRCRQELVEESWCRMEIEGERLLLIKFKPRRLFKLRRPTTTLTRTR
jgi:hypothetical protein